jgi:hypothetical protein
MVTSLVDLATRERLATVVMRTCAVEAGEDAVGDFERYVGDEEELGSEGRDCKLVITGEGTFVEVEALRAGIEDDEIGDARTGIVLGESVRSSLGSDEGDERVVGGVGDSVENVVHGSGTEDLVEVKFFDKGLKTLGDRGTSRSREFTIGDTGVIFVSDTVGVEVATGKGEVLGGRTMSVFGLVELDGHPANSLHEATRLEGHGSAIRLVAVTDMGVATENEDGSGRMDGTDGAEDGRPAVLVHRHMAGEEEETRLLLDGIHELEGIEFI